MLGFQLSRFFSHRFSLHTGTLFGSFSILYSWRRAKRQIKAAYSWCMVKLSINTIYLLFTDGNTKDFSSSVRDYNVYFHRLFYTRTYAHCVEETKKNTEEVMLYSNYQNITYTHTKKPTHTHREIKRKKNKVMTNKYWSNRMDNVWQKLL